MSQHPSLIAERKKVEEAFRNKILTIISVDLLLEHLSMPEAVIARVKDLIREA